MRKILWADWWRFPYLKECAWRCILILLIEPALEQLVVTCLCTNTTENKKVERLVFNKYVI